MLSEKDKAAELVKVADGIAQCQACGLARSRNQTVPGQGSPNATILMIGEAPGYHEDQQGLPFVGPAGQFLDELVASIGLRREDVYICNIIKCRPPQNRDPLPTEVLACRPWLDRQIEIIQPKIIVTLGRFSLARYFPGQSISKIHGRERRRGDVIYFPMYHPAAALHRGSLRQTIEEDMKKLIPLLDEAKELKGATPEPRQLTMF